MIHPAAYSFDLDAAAYERGRPDYPSSAIKAIARELRITAKSTVVDLAAGTGKFTRLLIPTGAHLIAVEPMRGMREELRKWASDIKILAGIAESIPLARASADTITVAQAFHWFRIEEAIAEIYRVLRPDGGLALLWNRRDLGQPLQQAIHEIVIPYRGIEPEHDSDNWREGFDRTNLFTSLQERHFPHSQNVNTAGLIDRVISFSYIATLPESDKDVVRARLRSLTRSMPERFGLRYITTVFCCHVRNAAFPR